MPNAVINGIFFSIQDHISAEQDVREVMMLFYCFIKKTLLDFDFFRFRKFAILLKTLRIIREKY